MAAPISHIVLALKIFDKYFSDKDKSKFIIGTSFPDIRYLRVIDREKTHFPDLKIEDLQKDDSFMAGVKFHSIVDDTRYQYMKQNDLYKMLPEVRFTTQSEKFYEDTLNYSYVDIWQEISTYFDDILDEELEFGIERESIIYWHTTLKEYFNQRTNLKSACTFVESLPKGEVMVPDIKIMFEDLDHNLKAQKIIKNFNDDFDKLI